PSELCRATVEMLVSILASEAGNLALKVLATGGIYMAGGIALQLLSALQESQFMQTFTRKGRFKDLMARMPVHVITTRAALVGAATYGHADRKSTRLNSSHVAISYAVFCLKKKKKRRECGKDDRHEYK